MVMAEVQGENVATTAGCIPQLEARSRETAPSNACRVRPFVSNLPGCHGSGHAIQLANAIFR